MDDDTRNTIRWEAPEFRHYEKGIDWYWWLGLVVAAGIVLSLFLGNYLLAVLIALGGVLLGVYAARAPRTIAFELNEQGIAVGDKLYPYEELDAFSLVTSEDGETRIVIESKKTWMPHLTIPLADVATRDVYEHLAAHLTEKKELDEPLLEQLMRFLRL